MEVEVFTRVGVWKTYEEMEECLSVSELIDSANGLRRQDKEMFRMLAITQTGEDPFEHETRSEKTVADIIRKVTGHDYGDDVVNELNAELSVDGINAFGYESE
jgi:hypothetical protein